MDEGDLWKVARHMTSEAKIREVGFALGLENVDMNAKFRNHHNNIDEAAYAILQVWRERVSTEEEAYVKLGEALIQAKLKNVAFKVLRYEGTFAGK